MTTHQKQTFIEKELGHELRCLLGAATVWQIFKNSAAGFDVVVAMDSAFVHARCLFNFFTRPNGNDISIAEFGPAVYQSTLYDTWEEPLNRHVLHVSKGRTNPTNTKNSTHINEQVVLFANEILSLWDQFAADPLAASFSPAINKARVDAVRAANDDASKRITPLFI